ncbi:MAG TPA: phasin family protein [Stellaceae bacterium]|nr:phasin family protein [Stellaceae bacterium]
MPRRGGRLGALTTWARAAPIASVEGGERPSRRHDRALQARLILIDKPVIRAQYDSSRGRRAVGEIELDQCAPHRPALDFRTIYQIKKEEEMSDTGSAPSARRRKAAIAAGEPSAAAEASADIEGSVPAELSAHIRSPLPAMAAGEQVVEHWLHGMSALSQEIARFTQQRLQEDADTWMKLASCRSVEEAIACQQRFAETAMKQYLDEAARVSHLLVGMTNWTAPPAAAA